MRQIEDFVNWLTDMDWGWWPVVSLRPPKDRDIDNRVLLQMSSSFGSAIGIVTFLLFVIWRPLAFSATYLFISILVGFVLFFLGYKITFAYFWNRRARRLRRAHIKNEPTA